MYYLISHVYHQKNQSIYGPVHVLANFFKKKKKRYRVILLPLEAEGNYLIKHGTKTVFKQVNRFNNLLLRYIFDLFFLTKYIVGQNLTKRDTVIAIDPLNCFLFGLIKPLVGFKLIYYTADYADHRFNSKVLNQIYFFLDWFSLSVCNQNWCVSSRIVSQRKKSGFAPKTKFVPNTPVLPFSPRRQKKLYQNNLIYVGRMDKNMKIDQLLQAVKKLYQKNKKIRLVLIGGGILEKEILGYIAKHSLKNVIKYFGPLGNEQVINHLKKAGIGLALYSGGNNWNRYGDSMKIREYQYLGLPVISTTIPSNSVEINNSGSGIIIKQSEITAARVTSAIRKIQLNYNQYSNQAHQLSVVRDKEKILAELLNL